MILTPHVLPDETLLDTESVELSVSPTDAAGNPASVTPTWESSDPSVGLEVSDDGLSATATTPQESGSSVITVSAPGFRPWQVMIGYAPPKPGEMNLSVGERKPD